MSTFYINGTTLANSTSVFTDATLILCAPNGFYSDGSGISREQVDCILGPIQNCPACILPCGEPIIKVTAGAGIESMQFDTGILSSEAPMNRGATSITTIHPGGHLFDQG